MRRRDDLLSWLARSSGGRPSKEALREGGAVLALRLLRAAGARELPAADALRRSSTAAARLHNWKLLVQPLRSVGVPLGADRKAMVVAGDAATTIGVLRAIHALLPSAEHGAASSDAGVAPEAEALMVDMAADGQLELPVMASDLQQIATDTAVSPSSARTVAEFFVICASQQLGLDPEEAATALSGAPGRQPIARILVEGIGGPSGALALLPVERMLQQVHSHSETLAALIIASLRHDSASSRRSGAMFLPALCTLTPGLSSTSAAVAVWTNRIVASLANALVRADPRFGEQLSRWFRGHSVRGVCPAPWSAAAGLVRFVELHCGGRESAGGASERERHQTLAQEAVPMLGVCVADAGHMRDLFGAIVTRAVPGLAHDELRMLRFARRLVPSLAAHGGCREEFARCGGAAELARAALRGANAKEASFALATRTPTTATTTMRDADDTRIVAVALLAELWRGFPESIEGGGGGGGLGGGRGSRSGGGRHEVLSLQVLAEYRRAVRRGSNALQTTAVHALFLVMRSLARRRSSFSGVVFKTIVFALVERPLIGGGVDAGIHLLLCAELKRLLPVYKRVPIAMLVVPLVKQASLLGGRFLDFSLLAIIATHSMLSLRHGLLLLDALCRISLNDPIRARDAKNPLIALIKRFGETAEVYKFLCRTATVAVVTLVTVRPAASTPELDAPDDVEKRTLAATFLRCVILLDVQSAAEVSQPALLGNGDLNNAAALLNGSGLPAADAAYGADADPQPCLNRWLAPRLMLAVARMRAQSDVRAASGEADAISDIEAEARNAEVLATVRSLLRLTKVDVHEQFAQMREKAEAIATARRIAQQKIEATERRAVEVRDTLRREREARARELQALEEQAEWERNARERQQQRQRQREQERREREEQAQLRMDEELRREEQEEREEWEQQMRDRQLERKRRRREYARREHEKRLRLEEELRREEEEEFLAEQRQRQQQQPREGGGDCDRESLSPRRTHFHGRSEEREPSPQRRTPRSSGGGGATSRVLTTIFSDEDEDDEPTHLDRKGRGGKASSSFTSSPPQRDAGAVMIVDRAQVIDETSRLDAIEAGAFDDRAFWSSDTTMMDSTQSPLPVLFSGLESILRALFKTYSSLQTKTSMINRPTSFDDISKSASTISVGEWVRLLRDFCIVNQRTALSMRRVEAQEIFRKWCGPQSQDVTYRRFLGLIAHLTQSDKFSRALDKRPFLGDIKAGGGLPAYSHQMNNSHHSLFRKRILTLLRHMRSVVVDERRRRGMVKSRSKNGASSSASGQSKPGRSSKDIPRPMLELRLWRPLKPYVGGREDELAAAAYAQVSSPQNRAKTPGSPYRSARNSRERSPRWSAEQREAADELLLPPQSDSERSWRAAQRRVQSKRPADADESDELDVDDPDFIAQLVTLYRSQSDSPPTGDKDITIAQVQEGMVSISSKREAAAATTPSPTQVAAPLVHASPQSGFRFGATSVAIPLIRQACARVAEASAGRVGRDELLVAFRRDLAIAEFLRLVCSHDATRATGLSASATIGEAVEQFFSNMGAAVQDVDELIAFIELCSLPPSNQGPPLDLRRQTLPLPTSSSVAVRLEEAAALKAVVVEEESALDEVAPLTSSIANRLDQAKALLHAHDAHDEVALEASSIQSRIAQAKVLLRTQVATAAAIVAAPAPSSVEARLEQAKVLAEVHAKLLAAHASVEEEAAAPLASSIATRLDQAKALLLVHAATAEPLQSLATTSSVLNRLEQAKMLLHSAVAATEAMVAEPASSSSSSIEARLKQAKALAEAHEKLVAAEIQQKAAAKAAEEAAAREAAAELAAAQAAARSAEAIAAAAMGTVELWGRVEARQEAPSRLDAVDDLESARHEVMLARLLLRKLAAAAEAAAAKAAVAAEAAKAAEAVQAAQADAAAKLAAAAAAQAAAAELAHAVEIAAAAARAQELLEAENATHAELWCKLGARTRADAGAANRDLVSVRHEVALLRVLLPKLAVAAKDAAAAVQVTVPEPTAVVGNGVDEDDEDESSEEEEEMVFQQDAPKEIVDKFARG